MSLAQTLHQSFFRASFVSGIKSRPMVALITAGKIETMVLLNLRAKIKRLSQKEKQTRMWSTAKLYSRFRPILGPLFLGPRTDLLAGL